MKVRPAASVCIPARNEAARIGRQLGALCEQSTERAFEVVVADNGSTDSTVAVVDSFRSDLLVRTVDASRASGINVARNEAAMAARGALILFCDADDAVQPQWVEEMCRELKGSHFIIGGRSEMVSSESGEFLGVHAPHRYDPPGFRTVLGANFGFRRELLDHIGGFDESFIGGHDEIEFTYRAWRAGYDVGYAEGAIVMYSVPRRRLSGRLAHEYRRGIQQGRFWELVRDHGFDVGQRLTSGQVVRGAAASAIHGAAPTAVLARLARGFGIRAGQLESRPHDGPVQIIQ